MKKFLALALVVVMVLGLVGCNKKADRTDTIKDEVDLVTEDTPDVTDADEPEDSEDDLLKFEDDGVLTFEDSDEFTETDDFAVDPETGDLFYNDSLSVTVDPSVPVEELVDAFSAFNIQVEEVLPGMGLYNATLDRAYTFDELNDLISQLVEFDFVQAVAKNPFTAEMYSDSIESDISEEIDAVG